MRYRIFEEAKKKDEDTKIDEADKGDKTQANKDRQDDDDDDEYNNEED